MIICYGEILLDQFEDKNTKKVQSYVGGAPFNVAYQIHKMGGSVKFIGNIGKDEAGKKILSFFNENNLDDSALHILKDKKTTIAKVELNHGERSFHFLRDNSADDCFDDDSLDLIAQGDVIHVGSLMLSSEKGRDFLHRIVEYARAQKKVLSFDINYRSDIFPSQEDAKKIYLETFPHFDIVKFSKEELSFLTDEEDMEKALRKIKGPKLILVTLGKDGSLAYFNNKIIKAKSIKTNVIDTTGAGDAFFGTFLSNVDSIGLREMMFIPSLMESTLKFSNIAGGLTCQKKGAIQAIPSFKEVNQVLEKQTFQK
jgi:fructokinase